MKGGGLGLVTILFFLLAISVLFSSNAFTSEVGEAIEKEATVQLGVYSMDSALDTSTLYLETSLRFSLYQAAYDLGLNGGYGDIPQEQTVIVDDASYPLWWMDGVLLVADADLREQLEQRVLQNLNVYTTDDVRVLDTFAVDLPRYTQLTIEQEDPLTVAAVPEKQLEIAERKETGETLVVRKNAGLRQTLDIPLLSFYAQGQILADALGRSADQLIQEELGRSQWITAATGTAETCDELFAATSGKSIEKAEEEIADALVLRFQEALVPPEIAPGNILTPYPFRAEPLSITATITSSGSPDARIGCTYDYGVESAIQIIIVDDEEGHTYPVFTGEAVSLEPLRLSFTIQRTYESEEGILEVTEETYFGEVASIPDEYEGFIQVAGQRYGVDPLLIAAVIQAESSWRPTVVSKSAGAIGLMQLLPTTASRYGVATAEELNDPEKNINAGTQYLADLLSWFGEDGVGFGECSEETADFARDLEYAIAAYNAGECRNVESTNCPGNTQWECLANMGFGDTRDYVSRVLNFYAQYQEEVEQMMMA